MSRDARFKIVSFSGIDGAGKSTQIRALQARLNGLGLRSTIFTFWDDVVVLSRLREAASRRAFKGDQGIGSPQNPINRRDKNVTSPQVVAVRFLLYFLDALHLRFFSLERRGDADVVIYDRYIYDELANLPLHHRFARWYTRLILKVAPKPDIAYLIDADPAAARARKPEYPLEFLLQNRERYLELSRLLGDMITIEPLSIEAAEAKMTDALLKSPIPKLSDRGLAFGMTAPDA